MSSLALVEFEDTANKLVDGLVAVKDALSINDPHERAILLEAAAFEHVHYVYFRRFADEDVVRSSQVAAYVVDNSDQSLTEDDLAKLHHKLWLHGVAPLVYIAWPTRIDILTCVRKPDFWDDTDDGGVARYQYAARIEPPLSQTSQPTIGAQAINTVAEISEAFNRLRRQFSANRLVDGTFWDDPDNQNLAHAEAAAHQRLIQAIVETDRFLDGANHPIRRRLLVLVVLIKYLEDRKVIPTSYFGEFHPGAESFLDILRGGTVDEVLRLLGDLARKFNGDVFALGNDYDNLTQTELHRFADLVAADEIGGQKHFWQLFSFEHIPVEVISRIYQRFVKGHGTVYTPPFLASLLLDQVMPYEKMTGKERVLDPACGSGIFLVGAFRRLAVHWRSRHKWQKPTVNDLKHILAHSIHGVEMESGAIDLTAFSLALALCDALDPPVIWSQLKFDVLRGRNLRHGDFFDDATLTDRPDHCWPDKFDVVVGNPPFESELTPAATAVDSIRPKGQPKLPDKQVAYLFLEQCLGKLEPRGALCLIQPPGLLYNRKPSAFRKHLIDLCNLHTVFDFVSIRGMFEGQGADAKPIAWHAVNEPSTGQPIIHLTFRRTYSTAERIGLEIDHYDWHLVSQKEARDHPFIWRTGLLGGGRLHALSSRFDSNAENEHGRMRTLKEFISSKGSDWKYSEGFIAGDKGERIAAEYLTGSRLLPTSAFTNEGIDFEQIEHVKETLFAVPHKRELYESPLILIKEHVSLPLAFWNSGVLAFRDKIVGIHAPPEQQSELQHVFDMLQDHKRFYQFCCTINGTQSLVGKATAILKQDIDGLPFPDDPAELNLSFWEEALKEDVLNYMMEYVRLGQDSVLLKNTANEQDLDDFSSLYVRMLGSLYSNLQAHSPVFLNGLIAQPFYFGAHADVSWLGPDSETALHSLVYDYSRESLCTVRVIRYYEGNVILIVKPDRLRYWLRSTAIRDADDTLTDLHRQG